MNGRMTFGRRLILGFLAIAGIALLIAAVGIGTLLVVAESQSELLDANEQLTLAEQMDTAAARRLAANRGFLLTGKESFNEERNRYRMEFDSKLEALLGRTTPESNTRRLLERVGALNVTQQAVSDRVIALRQQGQSVDEVAAAFDNEVVPATDVTTKAIADFNKAVEEMRSRARQRAQNATYIGIGVLGGVAVIGLIMALWMSTYLTRALTRQVGSAVQHMQSSSAELQAAANQQTAGAKEQAASMNEISTTIKELLLTARQIAEGAKRVASIAEETVDAAEGGDESVRKAQEGVVGIRRQVDEVVSHMMDLGKKSQQIGAILEIINELAEQTNILAINATIEAAGAGESGRRFGVVADEIRRLADRVGGSTKEIRGLIEEIRAAVNKTVMATESGSKAVDAGAKQVGDVAVAFRRIVDLLGTTTEATREIELSTKQQSTAVEQVNVAIANVTQASREAEASSGQVLQTVTELNGLSRDLGQLIHSNGKAA